MKKLLMTTVAAMVLATAANAGEITTLSRTGFWTAYQMVNKDGIPVCGMRAGESCRSVYVKWFAGYSTVTVQLFKDSWRIPEDTKLSLSVTFDHDHFGTADDATGGMFRYDNGNVSGTVDANLGADQIGKFVEQFAHADKMLIGFPGGNEPAWNVDMTGSRDAANAFVACMQRTRAPTQPFGQGQSASTLPRPTQ